MRKRNFLKMLHFLLKMSHPNKSQCVEVSTLLCKGVQNDWWTQNKNWYLTISLHEYSDFSLHKKLYYLDTYMVSQQVQYCEVLVKDS